MQTCQEFVLRIREIDRNADLDGITHDVEALRAVLAELVPAHGTERGRHMHRALTKTGAYEESRAERWCLYCRQWVAVRGVTGALAWKARHERGDCSPADETCPVCLEPAHASESDDFNRHAECQPGAERRERAALKAQSLRDEPGSWLLPDDEPPRCPVCDAPTAGEPTDDQGRHHDCAQVQDEIDQTAITVVPGSHVFPVELPADKWEQLWDIAVGDDEIGTARIEVLTDTYCSVLLHWDDGSVGEWIWDRGAWQLAADLAPDAATRSGMYD